MRNRNLNQIKLRLANKDKGSFRAEGNDLYLYDAIASDDEEAMWLGGISPNMFREKLFQMDGPVRIRHNSPGGSVFGAQAMIAAMHDYPHEITSQIDSLSASAASVIAANSDRVVMIPGAMMMIHNAWTISMGDRHDLRAEADLLEQIDGEIAGAYLRKAGDKTDWAAEMNKESWYGAAAALEKGLSDETIETSPRASQNRWDLSAFKNTPQPIEEPAPTAEEVEEIVLPESAVIQVEEVDQGAEIQAREMENRKRRVALIEKGI